MLNSDKKPIHVNMRYLLQVKAGTALISYIDEHFPNCAPSLTPPTEFDSSKSMKLDSTTLKALEVVKSLNSLTKKGSLLSIIDHTKTAGGKRLLASRLVSPSSCIKEVNRRLDLVDFWFQNTHLISDTRNLLEGCNDIERSLQGLNTKDNEMRNFIAIVSTLKKAMALRDYLSNKKILNLGIMEDFNKVVETSEAIYNGENNSPDWIISRGIYSGLDSFKDEYLEMESLKLEMSVQISLEFNRISSTFSSKVILNEQYDLGAICEIRANESTFKEIEEIVKCSPNSRTISSRRKKGRLYFTHTRWTTLCGEMKAVTVLSLVKSNTFRNRLFRLKMRFSKMPVLI
jgi:DNA mismatch repair ATPase MutS